MPYEFEIHPKAEAEFDGFLNRDRTAAFDVGNHFLILEKIVKAGFAEGLMPVHTEHGCDIHLFFGNRIQMFVARYGVTLLLAHLSVIGTESWQQNALQRVIDRSKEHFGL